MQIAALMARLLCIIVIYIKLLKMKKLFFSLFFLLCSIVMFAQKNNRNKPPAAVQQSFQKDYPNTGNATWHHQRNGQWNATYKDADKNRNVNTYYDRTGRHIETRTNTQTKRKYTK